MKKPTWEQPQDDDDNWLDDLPPDEREDVLYATDWERVWEQRHDK